MTRPRNTQVCVEDTPYYHIVARCVRRSFLCGVDSSTGKDYEHRRRWIEDRIRLLSSLFSIDICTYAVMSNHLHIVVKLCPQAVDDCSDRQVLERWTSLFKGPLLVQKWLSNQSLSVAQRQAVDDCVEVYRNRLASLSWFMKCLNEPIARQANKEDNCTGHFWEARYKSQALLTEEALLSCMSYVDLNPIRANMAKTPETSDFTGIKERITPTFDQHQAIKEPIAQGSLQGFECSIKPLLPFEGATTEKMGLGIPFAWTDYLELVDFTGRCLREDKRGAIPLHLPPILQRLQISRADWFNNATKFEQRYQSRFSKMRRDRVNTS